MRCARAGSYRTVGEYTAARTSVTSGSMSPDCYLKIPPGTQLAARLRWVAIYRDDN